MTFFCSSDNDIIVTKIRKKKLHFFVKILIFQRFFSFGTYFLNCDGHFGYFFRYIR